MPKAESPADALPSPRHSVLLRFRRVMKWMALLSIGVAAIAVLLAMRGAEGTPVHLLIVTALGVGLMALLGTGLMSLAFRSSSISHDERARGHAKDEDR